MSEAIPSRPLPVYFLRSLLLLLLLLGGLLGRPAAQAQGWTGLANSNYAGTNSLYWNPTAAADSPYRLFVNLAGADVNFYNSYLSLRLPYTPWQALRGTVPSEYRDQNNNILFKEEYLQENLDGKPKFVTASAEARLPSIMLALGPHSGLAFTNRVRGFVQATNVSEPVAQLARYGFGDAPRLDLANKLLDDNSFNVGVNAYHELALTYAHDFSENGPHVLKWGLTVKYLVGLGSAYVRNDGVNYQVYGGDSIQVNARHGGYGSTDYRYYDRNDFNVTDLYGSKRLGWGGGFDAGLSYEWRPDWEKHNYVMDSTQLAAPEKPYYKLKLGLALVDVGVLLYDNPGYVRQGGIAGTNAFQWGSLDTIKYRNLPAIDPLIQRTLGLNEKTTSFESYLPAALHLTGDYCLREHVYVGAAITQSLHRLHTVGARAVSSAALLPRVEYKQAELTLPLLWNNGYRNFQVGAMLRVGPLVLGSDNLGTLFGATTINGYDVYASVGWGLGQRRIADKDGDGVSDKLDLCPDVKGTWEFRGCPDRDHDHVRDSEDVCPDVPGLPEFKGCPDTDEDGLTDNEDACPTEAGPAETQGCPDRDGDTVKDSDDACPDVPGAVDHAGCPDTDSDGTYDDTDKCQTVAGPAENAGCPYPDTDGDTVLDKDDDCPTVAGPVENKGCPPPDKEEKKPVAQADPDTDHDGVLDPQDDCPLTPGPASNHGCPLLKKAEQRIVAAAFANLQFRTGKDVISPKSYPSLNALAKLLLTHSEFRLRLSGHTDNVGKPKANLLLSEKRAKAVQRYLARKGAPTSHIRAEWFGQTKPKASNKTPAGRAKNRRVEMKVLFE